MVFSSNNAQLYVPLVMDGWDKTVMSMMLFDSELNEMSGLSSVNCHALSSNVVHAL